MLDDQALKALLKPCEAAVSIYLPLSPEQRDIRLQTAELRTALGEAEDKLVAFGLDEAAAAALMAPLRDRLLGLDLATHREPALAAFAGPGEVQVVPLPEALPRVVSVGRHAYLKPLLPLLAQNQRFWLLALSAGRARLFAMTPFTLREVELEPATATTAAAPMPPAEHGANAAEDTAQQDTLAEALPQDLERLARVLQDKLGTDAAPVLLAAEPRILGHFRKTVPLPTLMEEALVLNPHAFPPAELQRRALELLRPVLRIPTEDLLEQIRARLGDATPDVAIRLEEILAAAEAGRVDALVVAADDVVWGRFEIDGQIVAHGHPTAQDEDLLNQAAVATLRNGGRSFALPRAEIPRASLAAATLRF